MSEAVAHAERSGVGIDAEASIIEVERLTKIYQARGARGGDRRAVDAVCCSLPAGGALGIVGESGSGKSTTAKMLVGLERPTAGRILVDGADHSLPARSTREWRRRGRRIQIVFQDPYSSLDRRQTIGDALAEVLAVHFRLSASDRSVRVLELTRMVGLDAGHLELRPDALSGGQRQRVAIARALAADPAILVLDEAVSALDVSIQAQVLNLLADIREERGLSYVFISHDLAVIRQITDQVIVMRGGVIVERGATADVLDDPQHPYTRLLRDSVPRAGWALDHGRAERTRMSAAHPISEGETQ